MVVTDYKYIGYYYSTITVPVIDGCILHTYEKVPAVLNVRLNLPSVLTVLSQDSLPVRVVECPVEVIK